MVEQTQWLHVLIDVAPDVAERSGTFWSSVLGWPLAEPWLGHPEFRSFNPPEGDSYIHQQIGDHGPRIHLDLEVAGYVTRRNGVLRDGQFARQSLNPTVMSRSERAGNSGRVHGVGGVNRRREVQPRECQRLSQVGFPLGSGTALARIDL
jgi:Glyoxalase-like domain